LYGRLTGDRLEEKGKNRQSICRWGHREFLTWFPGRLKSDELRALEFDRGLLAKLERPLEQKGAETSLELRVKSASDISVLKPDDPVKS
jgi:hypothetical protein